MAVVARNGHDRISWRVRGPQVELWRAHQGAKWRNPKDSLARCKHYCARYRRWLPQFCVVLSRSNNDSVPLLSLTATQFPQGRNSFVRDNCHLLAGTVLPEGAVVPPFTVVRTEGSIQPPAVFSSIRAALRHGVSFELRGSALEKISRSVIKY